MKIKIPSIFTLTAGDIDTIEVEGRNIGECLNAAQLKFPGIKIRLFNSQGQLSEYLNYFLNNRKINDDDLEIQVGDEDEISILPVILGG